MTWRYKYLVFKCCYDAIKLNTDVQQFIPEEIAVVTSVNNDAMVIECSMKYEEQPEEHGSIYKHFLQRYVISFP